MWKHKLGVCADIKTEKTTQEILEIIAEIGFEAFFTGWSADRPISEYAKKARELGLEYQSIHAPFGSVRSFWSGEEEAAEKALRELTDCLEDCARNEVPLMISHVYIGFDEHPPVTQKGLDYFARLLREAERHGVRIAFENTEGEEFLDAVLTSFRDNKYAGFCWDSGHEMCYNGSKDLIAKYGDRLFGTHLNDNLGVRDFGGRITWHDDLHLLPFDGIGNWENIAARLRRWQFTDVLTFELNRSSKPDRHENDAYARLTLEEYVTAAYMRACRVAVLTDLPEAP